MKPRILYHLTSPPPALPGTDALHQEIEAVSSLAEAEFIRLYPLATPSLLVPKALYGIHRTRALARADAGVDAHHIFYATLHSFPVLSLLKRPLVYSVVAGLRPGPRPKLPPSLHTVVVNNERDRAVLKGWGIVRHRLIRPAVDRARFTVSPPPGGRRFAVLVGSAPWTRAQFRSKGIDALLSLASRRDDLELVFLWRGLLRGELDRRIARFRVADRTQVIGERVDVNSVLARVHAVAVLAVSPLLVKAYPHSLMEAIAAGRPVLVSDPVAMADFVRETGCGEVVTSLDPASLETALDRLTTRYDDRRAAAADAAPAFDLGRMLDEFRSVYYSIVAETHR